MKRLELLENIRAKRSFLCVGLDPDINKIPHHLLSEQSPIFAFNKVPHSLSTSHLRTICSFVAFAF